MSIEAQIKKIEERLAAISENLPGLARNPIEYGAVIIELVNVAKELDERLQLLKKQQKDPLR